MAPVTQARKRPAKARSLRLSLPARAGTVCCSSQRSRSQSVKHLLGAHRNAICTGVAYIGQARIPLERGRHPGFLHAHAVR